jgi:hypothetical protein
VLIVMLFVLCLMTVSLWDSCLCNVFGQALLIMGIIVIMDNDWSIMNIEVNSDSFPHFNISHGRPFHQ